ncbi:hypothetical protein EHO59_10850 [Leptospira semungkisensis]|uniref:Uncharacterized protein n=1 Tax=Leptospira semungkisensis TaxID=2484985 RepID=A0A4V3JC12_9LEPT|nr:hypothetical protein EHO59_10850 [Leptospira semungkisensis]
MTTKEKILYHQIHPLKLMVDFCTGFLTTFLAWEHNLLWFLVLFLIPSIIATLVIIQFVDLERRKNSPFGKYIENYMGSSMQMIRSCGQLIMWFSAWFHLPILIILGFIVILAGWMNGLVIQWFRRKRN